MTKPASQPKNNFAKPASKIVSAIFGSRILGLIREIILNAIFGAGKELDAFITAFRYPNLLRDLLAEGALSTAFVTTFSKKMATDGKKQAFRLANLTLTTLTLFMLIVVGLGIWGSDWIVQMQVGWFENTDPNKVDLTIELTQILFPFIFFVSLAALYMGLLNSLGSFGIPASASMAFNLVSILSGLGLGYYFDPQLGPNAIYGFAIGTVIGGAAQLLIQIPKAWSYGYRPKPLFDFKDEGLRKVLILMGPAILGGAAVQINVLVNGAFAYAHENGAVTWLYNAFRLMQLPIGLFGVSIAMITTPTLSKTIALKQPEDFASHLRSGLSFTFFLTLPASVGLFLLAEPIISLIYEHGKFTEFDTSKTTLALQGYLLGLAAYSGIKVLVPAFYALDAPRIPVVVSIISIFLNAALCPFFLWSLNWGVKGLALSTACVALINFSQLFFHLTQKIPHFIRSKWLLDLLKMSLATLIMGGSLWGLRTYFFTLPNVSESFLMSSLLVAFLILFSATLYFVLTYFLRLKESTQCFDLFFKVLKSRKT